MTQLQQNITWYQIYIYMCVCVCVYVCVFEIQQLVISYPNVYQENIGWWFKLLMYVSLKYMKW